jgi:hypothetical protein
MHSPKVKMLIMLKLTVHRSQFNFSHIKDTHFDVNDDNSYYTLQMSIFKSAPQIWIIPSLTYHLLSWCLSVQTDHENIWSRHSLQNNSMN